MIRVRPATDLLTTATIDAWAFADDQLDDTPEQLARLEGLLDVDRTFVASVDDPPRDAGTYSAYTASLTLPFGGRVPAAGLTWVGVHPQERRRGVLRAMMGHHLDHVAERGEVLSALRAAEMPIYGRFGYGLASGTLRYTLPRGAALRDVPGSERFTAELLTVADHAVDDLVARIGPVEAEAGGLRPGALLRENSFAWTDTLDDPPHRRHDAEPLRLLVVSRDGVPRGYALFRRRVAWTDGCPDGSVDVREAASVGPDAAHALWSRLLDLDLMARVVTQSLPVDDPLTHLLVDPRAGRPLLGDDLWVRIVDLPRALTGRGWAVPLDVVLEVHDPLRADVAGRWHLVAGPDGASCERTTRTADLELGVAALSAALLGGTSLTALARAGQVTASDVRALTAATVAFGSPVAPHCPWHF